MIHTFKPTLTHTRTQTGKELLQTDSEFGSVSGYLSNSNIVSIEQLTIEEKYRREGIGTFLLQVTIRGAAEISERPIEYADFTVTNPHSVGLLRRLFGESVQYFANELDRETKTNGIDGISAEVLTTIRQERAREFEEANQEFPSDFEPGVLALARLHPEVIETWPMPKIVKATIPYWDS